ncbi:DUF4174 domain-containing protein [Pseudooceanicola atlanticus]|uniref:DUF4174 domain-containing protein n=1 Tax=Pseudooceanicola atlanticus TaxID=1461694 RepID=A0A0A0EFK3_9RHOB|nr:DUF4174 domain-containing protein [Pseudooceanicola atlanticus]KGM48838.1 hypothetical protein ATO9_09000 [Pseudooceanicola atlanticus]
MKNFTKIVLACGAALSALTLSQAQAADRVGEALAPDMATLERYRWQARPVLIFAPSPEDPSYRAATAQLAALRDGLAERDIVVLVDTDPDAGGALRDRLGAEGFEMLLVGKDGGVKMRAGEVIAPETLFATIDRMPMRQREMQE